MIGLAHRSPTRPGALEEHLGVARALGYEAVVPVVGPDAVEGPSRAWYREHGLAVWAVAEESTSAAPHLAEASPAGARAARERVLGLTQRAGALGCRVVRIEAGRIALPGSEDLVRRVAARDAEARDELLRRRRGARDRALEAVCRNLHALLAQAGDYAFALAPAAHPLAVPLADELELVLSSLASPRLGYWHAPDRLAWLEARGLGEAGAWLHAAPARLWGVSVADLAGDRLGQLPGTGTLDWREMCRQVSTATRFVVELDGPVSQMELMMALEFMNGVAS